MLSLPLFVWHVSELLPGVELGVVGAIMQLRMRGIRDPVVIAVPQGRVPGLPPILGGDFLNVIGLNLHGSLGSGGFQVHFQLRVVKKLAFGTNPGMRGEI